MAGGAVLDLSPGAGLVLYGREWMVERREPHLGRVHLVAGDGTGPGEPRPEYHPDTTTVTTRRMAKVAELRAMDPEEARLLGLDAVGYRTLIRWENARRRFGLVGCADDRWLRESGGHPTITPEVREAILVVRDETLHSARVSNADQGHQDPPVRLGDVRA